MYFFGKETYGLCITVGGLLWSTGKSLSEKVLSSLVSAVASWLCLSCTNSVAFSNPLPSFCYLYKVCTYTIIKVMVSLKKLSMLSYLDQSLSTIVWVPSCIVWVNFFLFHGLCCFISGFFFQQILILTL